MSANIKYFTGKTSLGMKFIYDSFVIPVDDSDSPFLKGYCRDLDPAEAGEKAYKHLHVGDSYTAKIQIMDTMGAEKCVFLS